MHYLIRRIFVGLVIAIILGVARRAVFSHDALGSFHFPSFGNMNVAHASVDKVPIEEHYGPSENLERVDVRLLEQGTTDHLDLAMYSFTDRDLANEVLRLARNGAKIRIYRDNQQYNEELRRNDPVIHMLAENENIQVRVKNDHALMHLKAWSNGTLLREGSANWSVSGEKYQDNSLFVFRDRGSIDAFEREFNAMWSRSDNEIVQ
jgi:phosphatidylserine/phosphatidylglycerophosphate/cardiolipin synthase-like enzyme